MMKEYSSLSDEGISESEGDIYKNITKSLAGTRPENVFYKLSVIEDLISRDEYVCKEAGLYVFQLPLVIVLLKFYFKI